MTIQLILPLKETLRQPHFITLTFYIFCAFFKIKILKIHLCSLHFCKYESICYLNQNWAEDLFMRTQFLLVTWRPRDDVVKLTCTFSRRRSTYVPV